jgi:hypothetical protein
MDTPNTPTPVLTDQQQSQLDKVVAAKQKTGTKLIREYEGVEFEFLFQSAMTIPAYQIVAKVQRLAQHKNPDIMHQLDLLMEFMDLMAYPDTAVMIGQLMLSGGINVNEVADIQEAVVKAIAARPTMRSSSSAAGLPTSGETSTASVPPVESMPPPSPSTVS